MPAQMVPLVFQAFSSSSAQANSQQCQPATGSLWRSRSNNSSRPFICEYSGFLILNHVVRSRPRRTGRRRAWLRCPLNPSCTHAGTTPCRVALRGRHTEVSRSWKVLSAPVLVHACGRCAFPSVYPCGRTSKDQRRRSRACDERANRGTVACRAYPRQTISPSSTVFPVSGGVSPLQRSEACQTKDVSIGSSQNRSGSTGEVGAGQAG